MPNATRRLALASALIAVSVGAQAQNDEQRLEPVDVISTTPFEGSEVDANRYPANVQSSTAEDIERTDPVNMVEFLNTELGSVHINDAVNNPFQPDLKYRGYVASPLLGLPQGISVYQDGVRVNEPFGDTVNFDLIPQAAIADIDLLPGSNPLFGLNTLGGALNIKTKTGFSHPGLQAEAYGGDFGRYGGHVSLGGNSGDLGWLFLVQGMEEDGWRDFSSSEVLQLFSKFSHIGANGETHFSVTAADNTLRGNGAVPRRLAEERGRDQIFTFPDETSPEMVMLNLRGVRDLGERLSLAWGGYYRKSDVDTFNGDGSEFEECSEFFGPNDPNADNLCEEPEEPGEMAEVVEQPNGDPIPANDTTEGGTQNTSSTEQDGWGVNLQLQSPGLIGGELTTGLTYDAGDSDFASQQEVARLTAQRGTVGSGFFVGESFTRVNVDNSNIGAFFLHRAPLTPDLEWTLGGRFNRTEITLNDQTPAFATEPGNSLDGDHHFSRLNMTSGLAWEMSRQLTFFGSVGQSSRAPSPLELTCANPDAPCRLPNGFVDDPPLAQVVATTIEVGARGGTRNLAWRTAAFHAVNEDDIIFISAGNRFEGFFDNVGDTRRQGVELGMEWRVMPTVRLSADYTYLNAEFRDSFRVNSPNHPNREPDPANPGETRAADSAQQVNSGDRLPLVPEHIFKLGADWEASDLVRLGVDVIGNSDQIFRGDESNTDSETIDGFAIVNLRGEISVTSAVSLFARVNNVFDTDYETFGVYGESDEVLAGPQFEDAFRFIGPGAPRGIWGGIRVAL